MIRVTGLTKDYGSRRAIHDLTFNARKGEILGFLGPNGAGKTTTMRILTGFMPPTSGTVEIGGYDVIDHSLEVRRIVGYLPETVPLYPDMTVREYLEYMASLRHLKNIEKRVTETLEQVGMADRANGYISNLSKGMRQRVGLAQALIHQPEVLILDEPTIGLDPAQVVNIRKLIKEIGQNKTVILSTHILPEAQQICDRVMIINKGHIVAEDTPEQLQARLTGSQRVLLTVRGESQDVVPLIKQLPGILQVVEKEDGTLEYESLPGQDIRPLVARKIIEAGFDLLQLQPINMSLEEIFLQLTRDETEPSAAMPEVGYSMEEN
ncbi:ABC-type multidrug transport system, ATPase component [Anaerolinea thermolimosa]|uniref:ABC transporter ATP-binding protein n=1 Tax=Anaerolinea thermolimosa TaxID=229919 RepID=UPI000780CB01|nr:ATP-binding cassette domain-containing protein [Anaerolinea thermolimosa]GAP06677.1 ABC-type multidrug transport system, ATPase component [Anaerolinea thermolimosa]